MSTSTNQLSNQTDRTPQWPVFAALGSSVAAVLTAIGTFVDVVGPEEQRTDGMADFYSWLFIVGVIAVLTVVVFGLTVRTASGGRASTRGLVLALLAVPTVLVAWTGFPPVLAAGAVACAVAAKEGRGHFSGQDKASLGLAGLAMAGAILFALAG